MHCYSIELAGELVLFDTGPPTAEARAYLQRALPLKRLRHVIVTHCHIDHYGLAAWLEREYGATVYLPYLTGIPNDVTEVYLPIAMTYDGYGGSFYWPLLLQATGSNGTFEWGQTHVIDNGQSSMTSMGSPLGDTLVLLGVHFFDSYEGNYIHYSLRYDRVTPGSGDIAIAPTDRYDPLRFAVGRNVSGLDVDLHTPVVVYVDVSYKMGDCDCSGTLDIADLVCMVDYMFGSGSACQPYLQPYSIHILDIGCTGDGNTDISDLVYFVDFMFNGGPPPCDPFAP